MCFDDIFNLYWNDENNYNIIDKQRRTREHIIYMLDRTQQIFKWKGLPETIPQHNLEFLLQVNGNACITEVEEVPDGRGKAGLYAFFGGMGGMLNAYYEPTIYTVANPYLEYNKELEIGKDCIRARNDKNGIGLIPLFMRYGAMMNENEISLNMLAINYRIDNLISADDDRTYESAKEYLNNIVAGKFGAISSSEFFEGIKTDKSGSTNKNIKDLIEYEQYLKASWYNEIGLNSNYNMKRERIVSAEAELTDDALIPLVDNMLDWRLKACEEIKELYSDKYDLEDLTVELNAIWDLDKMYIDMLPETSERSENDTEDTEDIEDGDNTDNIPNGAGSISDDINNNDIQEVIEDDNTDGANDSGVIDNNDDNNIDINDEVEDIKEDIEDIKDDIEDIKREVKNGDDETNTETV